MCETWLGTSLDNMYKPGGPWGFYTCPVLPSKYHAVLYELPIVPNSVPKPHCSSVKHWDDDHVQLPHSSKNLFPLEENGREVLHSRWNLICQALSMPIKTSIDLEKTIHSYNSYMPKFDALHYFFNEVLEEEESIEFFENFLPRLSKLALLLPELISADIPLLKKGFNRSVSLSQMQIASLLANAFFCTFPWRKDVAAICPGVNFSRLFAAHSRPKRKHCIAEKFKCIFHYFRNVMNKSPVGVVTFERKFISKSNIARWDTLDNNLGATRLHVTSSGTIEDGIGFLQVDFANKNVGGGVLGYGCVQEEIRFVICPELIISRLFVEQLGDTEAVIVTGVERFSNYSGYGDTFEWAGNFTDESPFDEDGRRKTTISIIDATRFNRPGDQYFPSAMLRELSKAYVGFSSNVKENLAPVATGNWGCGAFKGDPNLKSLLQLVACNAAGRDMVYYSFGNDDIRDDLYQMHLFLGTNRITSCDLWRMLCKFASSGSPQNKLYAFIQQAYFDSKRRPSVHTNLRFTEENLSNRPGTSQSKSTKRKEKKSPDKTSFEDECVPLSLCGSEDIIESSQPEIDRKFVYKNRLKKPKSGSAEVVKKIEQSYAGMSKLFEKIDGPIEQDEDSEKECNSFLTIVDNLKKTGSRTSSNFNINQTVGPDEIMEVDSIDESGMEVQDTSVVIKSKITDYFTKTSRSS